MRREESRGPRPEDGGAPAIAVEGASYKLKLLEQIYVKSTGPAAASCGMGRNTKLTWNGNFYRSQQPGHLAVEMPATGKVGVIGDFGNDVGVDVGCARVIGGVELYSQCSIEVEGENCFTLADVLLRILNA